MDIADKVQEELEVKRPFAEIDTEDGKKIRVPLELAVALDQQREIAKLMLEIGKLQKAMTTLLIACRHDHPDLFKKDETPKKVQ